MNIASNTSSSQNLIDTAAANGSFKTFGKAVERAGMSDTFRGAGPFTIFAPSMSSHQAFGWFRRLSGFSSRPYRDRSTGGPTGMRPIRSGSWQELPRSRCS